MPSISRYYANLEPQAKDPKTVAEKTKPLKEQGRPIKEEENKVDNINLKTIGGTSSSYLTARIARDNPAVLEEMKTGKYPSVRAAAKAAGILKEASALDLLKRTWSKASAEERKAFVVWTEEVRDEFTIEESSSSSLCETGRVDARCERGIERLSRGSARFALPASAEEEPSLSPSAACRGLVRPFA